MNPYTTVLFDLDNTLLDFDADERCALLKTLSENGIPTDEPVLRRYSAINSALWKQFEKGEITKEDIKNTRFQTLISEFGISTEKTPRQINDCYAEHLTEGGVLIDGAYELCMKIKERGMEIFIVTNGIKQTQQKRMKKSGLNKICKEVFISEKIGFQKPMKEYFDYVLSHIEQKDKSKIVLIGDSLSSDITGAQNAGLDCIWFNRSHAECTLEKAPTYETSGFGEILDILAPEKVPI
ncbi:MAG: YjjG family noncanonical pyrimidine nucleotidase [Acutalibacteraceae bacterium]